MYMLKKTIEDEMKNAMKAKEEVKLGTLRMLISVVRNREIEKRAKLVKSGAQGDVNVLGQLTDDEVLDAIRSEVKKRKDAITEYEKAGRPELAEKEAAELVFLQAYLPAELGDGEVERVVQEVIIALGDATIKDFGRVMGEATARLKGSASGDRIGAMVKKHLEHA